MATYLPGSGTLSINQINTLFGRGNNLNSYRGTQYYTSSGGPFTFSSGAISISNFYNTGPNSNTFTATISSNQTDLNLRTWALANGWNGSASAVITVAAGVYIYSTNTSNAGMTINGSWPGGVTVINNGYILGKGGNGGTSYPAAGFAGGPAISLGVNATITNNSGAYIAGGGGGGGTGISAGGGGAGGGNGGSGYQPTTVGQGGGPGASGTNGNQDVFYGKQITYWASGGGGGRILPGTGGSGGPASNGDGYGRGGGAGGGGGGQGTYGVSGGAGGSANNVGANGTGTTQLASGGGGGGWGASGGRAGYTPTIYAGGSGGNAIALNGYTATTSGAGTTYGSVS